MLAQVNFAGWPVFFWTLFAVALRRIPSMSMRPFPGFGLAALSISTVLAAISPETVVAKTHEIGMKAVETEVVIEGSGEKYAAWTFDGQVPGPVVRVTEGDTVKFTLTNPATNKYPHAMDFHAAEIDFLNNYKAINAGETISYTFVAKKPGIFFYHCGAPPMIQHVARGMFGAIIVDPKNASAWPKADREYVLIQSEYFKNADDVQAMFDRKVSSSITRSFRAEASSMRNPGNEYGSSSSTPAPMNSRHFIQSARFGTMSMKAAIRPTNCRESKPTWWARVVPRYSTLWSSPPVHIRSSPTR
jgi:FtsP/CotA-like multicopper oxidase with cupredoxin domain